MDVITVLLSLLSVISILLGVINFLYMNGKCWSLFICGIFLAVWACLSWSMYISSVTGESYIMFYMKSINEYTRVTKRECKTYTMGNDRCFTIDERFIKTNDMVIK